MSNDSKVLRDYQDEAVISCSRQICLGKRYVGIVSPTGSGKSLMMKAIAARVNSSKKISGGIVCAPFMSIENAFLKGGEETDRRSGEYYDLKIKRPRSMQKNRGHVEDDVIANMRSSQLFYDYRNCGYDCDDAVNEVTNGLFVVTTNQQLTNLDWKSYFFDNIEDLSGKLLIIDEAHHVTEDNILGDFVSSWIELGGQVLMVTATPYRTDGKKVFPDDAFIFTRTIAEHSCSGFSPKNFEIGSIAVDIESDNISEYYGEESVKNVKASVEAMISSWVADGKPKGVFNVPSGDSDRWAEEIEKEVKLKYPSMTVVNTVGKDVKDDFSEYLDKESLAAKKGFSESSVDIFVACQRFNEGTDWPFCSHVYNWGVPRSFSLIVQRWGRSFRDKRNIPGYPEKFKNIASIRFFVTKIDEDKLEKKHREHIWLISSFLHDWNTARNISHVFSNSFKSSWKSKCKDTNEEDLIIQVADMVSKHHMSEEEAANAVFDIAKVQKILSDNDISPTVKNILDYMQNDVDDSIFDSSFDNRLKILVKHSVVNKLDYGNETIRREIDKEVDRVSSCSFPPKIVDINFREIYLNIIKEHKDVTVKLYDEIASFCSEFTGEDIARVSEKIKNSYDIFKKVSYDIVKVWISKYHEYHKSIPSSYDVRSSKEFSGMDASWSTVYDRLKVVSGKNFFDIGIDLGIIKEISTHIIDDLCKDYLDSAGSHPNINSKFSSANLCYFLIDKSKNGNRLIETFYSVHFWLRENGHSGLNSYLGLPTNSKCNYSEADVGEWLFDFMNKNNFSELPKGRDVCGYSGRGTSWASIMKKYNKTLIQIAVEQNVIDVLSLNDLKKMHDAYYNPDKSDKCKGDGMVYAVCSDNKYKKFLFSSIDNLRRVAETNFGKGIKYFIPNKKQKGLFKEIEIIQKIVKSYFDQNNSLPSSEDLSCSYEYSGEKVNWNSISQTLKRNFKKNFLDVGADIGILKIIDKDNVISFINDYKNENGSFPIITSKIPSGVELYSIVKSNGVIGNPMITFKAIDDLLKKEFGFGISSFRESSNITFEFSDYDLMVALCRYFDGSIDQETAGKIPGKNSGDASKYFDGTTKTWEYFFRKNNKDNEDYSFANILEKTGRIIAIDQDTVVNIVKSYKESNGRLPSSKDRLCRQNVYFRKNIKTGKIHTVATNSFQSLTKNISDYGYDSIFDLATKNNL